MPAAVTPGSGPEIPGLARPRSPLFGRDRERAAVMALLRHDETGLLTLTGPGGVGKTRLALEIASALRSEFEQVVVVALAALRDPALVAATVAQALGIRETAGQSLLEMLKEYLSGKHVLLLVDNFEHLLSAAALVADLLAVSSRLKVLATSRAPLEVRGEREFAVEPLSLPSTEVAYSAELAWQSAAVALFVRRGQDVRPELALLDDNAGVIVEICRRLDGLPLALELAAVRLRVLSPQALLRRLERRLPLLTGGARDLPERQQTLRATIAWSYDLLPPAEQVLFRQSAVFVGGCTQEGVEAVCSGAAVSSVALLDALGSLVNNQLLRREEAADGEPRFMMLETIREFAEDQLEASGESAAVRERHADYFLAFATEAEPRMRMGQFADEAEPRARMGQRLWLRRVDAEYDNLRAALDWFNQCNRAAEALDLAGDLWFYWMVRGHLTEGRRRSIAALRLPGANAPGMPRARAVFGAGWLAAQQGDLNTAVAQYDELHELGQVTGDLSSITYAAIGRGQRCVMRGDDVNGRAHLERAFALAIQTGDRWVAGWIAVFLSPALIRQGELVHAQELLEQAVISRRQLADPFGLSAALGELAAVAVARGDASAAEPLAAEALALSRELDDRVNLHTRLRVLASVALDRGDLRTASDYCTEAVQVTRALGQKGGLASAVEGLAIVAAHSGEAERALVLFAAATRQRGTTEQVASPGWPQRIARAMDIARAAVGEARATVLMAQGAALRPDEVAAQAIAQRVLNGSFDASRPRPGGLTERQVEVAALIAQGKTNRQIAEALVVSERTAEHHVENIFTKLALSSRTQIGIWAVEHGLTGMAPRST